jgi:hypothetical protein
MLIAQIYHIDEHYPDGIFWWAMGVLPLAVLLESSLLMLLVACLGFIWFFVESSLGFYPALFPIFPAAILWYLKRGKQSNILFILLIAGVVLWAEYTLAWFLSPEPGFRPGSEAVALCVGLFLALHGLAKLLEQRQEPILADYGALLGVWVLRFAIVALLVFSFKFPWEELIVTGWQIPVLIVGLSIFLSALSVFLVYRAGESNLLTGVPGLLFIAGLLAVMHAENKEYAQVFQIIDNIVLIATGIRLITAGIQKSISHYFYLGMLTILATGLLRYIDFIGDYIGTAALFAVFAATLLLSAKYWKSHFAGAGGGS